jgi:hypothetical protein
MSCKSRYLTTRQRERQDSENDKTAKPSQQDRGFASWHACVRLSNCRGSSGFGGSDLQGRTQYRICDLGGLLLGGLTQEWQSQPDSLGSRRRDLHRLRQDLLPRAPHRHPPARCVRSMPLHLPQLMPNGASGSRNVSAMLPFGGGI